jgi:hypothetical protein
VKRFLKGDRPDVGDVFRRITLVVDKHIDFDRSLADQGSMCDLVACYALVSYLLDAFDVVGYLWPNGDKGAGKSYFLAVLTELAYLGQLILAGGSYASLRDLADYGATLAFDDTEGVMAVKRADPDKRALLLAGNRRGATVTVKELEGERWVTRFIHTFCPRAFSAIRLPDDVLASRTITVPLVRSCDPDRARSEPLDHSGWPADRRRLVDDLWAVGLTALPELRQYDARAARDSGMVGRELEPWRSIFAVALWLEERHGVAGLFGRMKALAKDYREKERGDLEASDPVRVVQYGYEGREENPGDVAFLWPHQEAADSGDEFLVPMVGACCFRWREWQDAPDGWALQWAWFHPWHRRRGLLSRSWPAFRQEFGAFLVEPPLSEAMAVFLAARGETWDGRGGKNPPLRFTAADEEV